jgi:hypothetical protein
VLVYPVFGLPRLVSYALLPRLRVHFVCCKWHPGPSLGKSDGEGSGELSSLQSDRRDSLPVYFTGVTVKLHDFLSSLHRFHTSPHRTSRFETLFRLAASTLYFYTPFRPFSSTLYFNKSFQHFPFNTSRRRFTSTRYATHIKHVLSASFACSSSLHHLSPKSLDGMALAMPFSLITASSFEIVETPRKRYRAERWTHKFPVGRAIQMRCKCEVSRYRCYALLRTLKSHAQLIVDGSCWTQPYLRPPLFHSVLILLSGHVERTTYQTCPESFAIWCTAKFWIPSLSPG